MTPECASARRLVSPKVVQARRTLILTCCAIAGVAAVLLFLVARGSAAGYQPVSVRLGAESRSENGASESIYSYQSDAQRLYSYQSEARRDQMRYQDARVERAKAEHVKLNSPQKVVDDELGRLNAERGKAVQAMAVTQMVQQVVLMMQLRQRFLTRIRAAPINEQRLNPDAASENHVCVVLRTYHAHGPGEDGSPGPLRELLESLRASAHQTWQVLIVVVDGSPFPALREMVATLKDPRIKIFRMLIGPEHSANMPDGSSRGYYHHNVFNETDKAINACKPNTRWFTATNGDNAYDPSFWSEVAAAPESAEVLAFDFYSRFHRLTSPQCHRFESGQSPLICKENLLRTGHTDLAALVFDWQKWRQENLGYSTLPELIDHEHEKFWGLHDGLAAHHVVETGWKIHWVGAGSRCLLAHSPNPQLCAMEGGVWDDTWKDKGGGKCMSMERGLAAGKETPGAELVEIQLAHDPTSFQKTSDTTAPIAAWRAASNYTIKCLRAIQEVPAKQAMEPTQFHQIVPFSDEDIAVLEAAQQELKQVFSTVVHENKHNIQKLPSYRPLWVVVLVMVLAVTATSRRKMRANTKPRWSS